MLINQVEMIESVMLRFDICHALHQVRRHVQRVLQLGTVCSVQRSHCGCLYMTGNRTSSIDKVSCATCDNM